LPAADEDSVLDSAGVAVAAVMMRMVVFRPHRQLTTLHHHYYTLVGSVKYSAEEDHHHLLSHHLRPTKLPPLPPLRNLVDEHICQRCSD
jgi:hypothetical protein